MSAFRKLKFILSRVPPGFMVDSRWLAENGAVRSSAHDYHQASWLERVAHGVYRRPYPNAAPDDTRGRKSPVLSAQWIMGYDFHVGAMSALTLEDHNHYLQLGRSAQISVFGGVPSWPSRLTLDAPFSIRRRQLFGSNPVGIANTDFDPQAANAPGPWNWPLKTASPERAILEALDLLPTHESLHKIDLVFQGLTALRPTRATQLLEFCKSVKVKRLFFLFADRHRHAWLKHIDRSKIDLGKGPRSLVDGGSYVPDYQLMVPAEFAEPWS
jgi:hypothetical protein